MNAHYVVIPAVLLTAFFGYEQIYQRQRDERERERAKVLAADREKQETARAKQLEVARHDAEKRTVERDQQDRERAAKKKHDYETLMATLQSHADTESAQAARLREEIERLSTRIGEVRARQAAIGDESRALTAQLEARRNARRDAELEMQRVTSLVTARADDLH